MEPQESEGCGYLGEQHSRQGRGKYKGPVAGASPAGLRNSIEQRLEQAEGGVGWLVWRSDSWYRLL